MGARYAAPFLRRRLPYPVVDGLPESKSVFGRKTSVVRMLRAGAAYGSEKVLQPCLLSQSHGGNTPPAGMRVVRGRVFNLCRGRTPILLPELCQRRTDRAKEFSVYAGEDRQYCCRNCANAAKTAPKNFQKGRRRFRNTEPESWAEHIKQAAREAELSRDSKRVRLVCGETSMYAGIDSLTAIVRYRLRFNPYDGSIYVFRDQSGTMLKYLHWDGQSFCQGKRRAQSGTYPWPDAPEGEIVEITEREFQYLLSRSIVPIKDRK